MCLRLDVVIRSLVLLVHLVLLKGDIVEMLWTYKGHGISFLNKTVLCTAKLRHKLCV